MSHRFDPVILREYDVRGTVGTNLSDADAYAVGRSFATRLRRAGGTSVAVGYDGRTHSPALEAALVRGLSEGGVDVVRVGLGPSPMLYYAAATLGVDGGVQVTGSHNPRDDNGFKLVLRGDSFFGDDITDLARLAAAGDWTSGQGRVSERDVRADYVDRLLAGDPERGEGRPLRVGWDAGSGAAGEVVRALTARLPGEHHLLFCEIDGNFPHHHPDPTVEANLADLKALIARERLDLGFAFDGDGDRIGAVDAAGRVLWGDEILALLAAPLLEELPGATIVADVKSSDALFDRIAALGGKALMWRTGHSEMKSKMKEVGAPLAGELSGHIFFAHGYYGFDDALYAAVRLLRAVRRAGQPLADLRAALPPRCTTPEWRVPVDEARKLAVVAEVAARLDAAAARVDRTDGVRVSVDDGWWLLRASNTQAALTLRAEARDEAGLARLVAAIDAELAASGVRR
ncbi:MULTISPECIES: phosphoglucomutase/phosphomannomutase PgmG [unclassified Sphingomonas]|uniref:phosphoglucomutase/phosphomannomutase PgmG n=1 Tax=unclassified Sphingomonas TaxID=196159 RepID=UPI001615564C|nr:MULTISPECIES: phosphomannomutase/phosphoglucomutase [unclassified Sphingomonas]MBB3347509.1 phosphomannomutase [Sphingomonas sp. BK069]MBB3472304.1 phosphomannomutase [Sphingomonas sp. BK345]